MRDFSKRQYLKYAGVGLVAASIGLPGTVVATTPTAAAPQTSARSGDWLDYEQNDDGEVQFDSFGVSFETRDGDIDLQDDGVDFQTTDDRDELDLTIDRGSVELDLRMADGGDRVDLQVAVGSEYVDFEFDEDDDTVEFSFANGGDYFEDRDGDIQYEGGALSIDWNGEDSELDVSGDVRVELRMDRDLEFEYDDGDVSIDYRVDDLEYVGEDVELRWEADSRRDYFEARRL